jgi:hypothetical protein
MRKHILFLTDQEQHQKIIKKMNLNFHTNRGQ